jgi:hypothetical protein
LTNLYVEFLLRELIVPAEASLKVGFDVGCIGSLPSLPFT